MLTAFYELIIWEGTSLNYVEAHQINHMEVLQRNANLPILQCSRLGWEKSLPL